MKVTYVPDDCEAVIVSQKEGPSYTCSDCIHFCQHWAPACGVPFINSIRGFHKVNAGHCMYPRIKDRKPGTPVCQYFEHG